MDIKSVVEKAKQGLDIQVDPIEDEGAVVITGTAMSADSFKTFYDRLQARLYDCQISGSGTYSEEDDTFEIGVTPEEKIEDNREDAADKAEQLPQDVSLEGGIKND